MSSGKTAVVNRNAPPQSAKASVGNSQNQPTAELVRLQRLNNTNKDDVDKQRRIEKVISFTNRSEDAVAMAMHDCDFDENKAINLLLDPDKFGEWETSGKKKKKGQATTNETNQIPNKDQDDNRSKPGRANRRYDRRRTGKTDNNAEQNDNNEKLPSKTNDVRSAGRGRGRGGRGAVQSQSRRNDNKFAQARQNKKPPNSSSSKDQQFTSQSERQQAKVSDPDIGKRPESVRDNQTPLQTSANDRRVRNVTTKTQTSTWSKTENLANKLKSSNRAKEMQQQRKDEVSAPVSDSFQNVSKKTNLQEDLWNTNSASNDNDRYRVPPGMESQWPAENSSSWDFENGNDNKTDGPSVLSDLPDLSHDKSLDLAALAKVSQQSQKELPAVKSDDLGTIPSTSSVPQPLAAISSPSKKQFLEGNGSEKGIQTNSHRSYDHPKQQRHPKSMKSKRPQKVEPPSKPVEMPHNVVESLSLQFGNLEFGFGSASPEMDSTTKLLQSGTQNEPVSPNTATTVAPGPVERPTNRNKSSASSPTTAPIGSIDQSGRQYQVSSVEKSQKETVSQVNNEQNLQPPESNSSAVAGDVSKSSSAATISATSSLSASTQSTVAPVISTANVNTGNSSFNNVVNPTSVNNPNYKNITTPVTGAKNAPTSVPYYFSAAPGMLPATYPANFAYGYDDMSIMSQRIGPFPHLYYDLQFQQYGMRPDAMGNTAGNYSTGNESGSKYGRVDTSSPVSSSISQAQQQGGPHHAASAAQQPPYLNPAMPQGFFPNVYYPGVVPGSFHTYAPVYGMPSKSHGGNMYLNNNTFSGQQGYDDGNAHNDFQAKNGFAGSNPQAQNKSNSNSGTDIANQNYKVQQSQYDKFGTTPAQLNMPLAHGAHAAAVPAGYVQPFMLPHLSQQPHPIEASQQQNQQHNQSNKQSAKPGSNNYQYWNTGANQA